MKSLIDYKGQDIEVNVIHSDTTVRGEGTDSLLRDADGFYYLTRHRELEDGGFCAVHRINVTAAILWSIDNIDRFHWLRQDAADCLMDVRLERCYLDPNPHAYFEIKKARGQQSAAKWVKKVLAGQALPAPTRRRTLNEARAASGEPALVPENTATINLTSKETGEQWDTLEIPRASFDEIERRAKAHGQDFATCLAEMVENYLRSQPVPLTEDDLEDEDAATEYEQLPDRQFSFDFKPTRQSVGQYIRIEVSGDAMTEVEKFADAFGLTPRAFLSRHLNDTLPGQATRHRRATDPLDELMKAGGFTFTCFDEAINFRLERAAEVRGLTVDDFIADAVGGAVDAFEADAILHPQTGEVLCEDGSGLYRRLETRETAPPIGQEADPQYLLSGGTNALMGHPKTVTAQLNVFHGDLLRAFERRNGIDAATYARAIVEWHLEEMYNPINGFETEPNVRESIQEDGRYNPPLTKEKVAGMCRAVGLDPADYPDASAEEDEVDEEPATATGRRQPGNPADVALLAAADPSADDDEEDEEEDQEPPTATDAGNGEEDK